MRLCSKLFALLTLSVSLQAIASLTNGACGPDQKTHVTTSHSAVVNGSKLDYTADLSFIEVNSIDASSKACIFYTSYVVKTVKPRPITFAFNGGPGSASVWLHLGMLGPKRVDMGADGTQFSSLELINNPDSPLDVTDLVLIDPVATGFSHTEVGDANKFFGVLNDYTAIAAFIQTYINDNNLWAAPKFIMGESYGGVRGSLVTNYLQNTLGIPIDGLILISPMLSNLSLDFSVPENKIAYWTAFPSMATAAWYHGKIGSKYLRFTLDHVFAAAKDFASTVYRDALERGANLSADELHLIAAQAAEFLGIPAEEIQQRSLLIDAPYFFTALLHKEHLEIGRFDSRFKDVLIENPTSDQPAYNDPSDSRTTLPYTAAINEYLHTELQLQSQSPYTLDGKITIWPEDPKLPETSVLIPLASALSQNPFLRVLVASGYFDLACPMGSVDYELSQLPEAPLFSKRIVRKNYVGGHMMYTNPLALKQLKSDLAEFISKRNPPLALGSK